MNEKANEKGIPYGLAEMLQSVPHKSGEIIVYDQKLIALRRQLSQIDSIIILTLCFPIRTISQGSFDEIFTDF